MPVERAPPPVCRRGILKRVLGVFVRVRKVGVSAVRFVARKLFLCPEVLLVRERRGRLSEVDGNKRFGAVLAAGVRRSRWPMGARGHNQILARVFI